MPWKKRVARLSASIAWRMPRFSLWRRYLKNSGRWDEYRHAVPFITAFKPTEIPGKKRRRFLIAIGSAVGESKIAVGLCVRHLRPGPMQERESWPNTHIMPFHAEVPINFTAESVDIETFQGSKGSQPTLSSFDSVTGRRWSGYIAEIVENTARRAGYSRVRIRDPRTLRSFNEPIVGLASPGIEKAQIQERILKLVMGVVRERGYVALGEHFVKDL